MSERAGRDDETRDLRGSGGSPAPARPAAAPPNAMTVTDTGSGLGALAATLAAPTDSSDLVGKTVDRYRVLSRLGAGGMGVVYAALDPALDRKVALKVLPPLSHDREQHLEARLRREAQALARLDHANVVRVYDVGVAEHSVFVAMQLVEGTTLAELLDQKHPPAAQVLALFVAAARGLAAAHDAGIVHRDVKPSNVLVDRAGKVYVGDFGLARGADADPETMPPRDPSTSDNLLDEAMTREGSVLGTPLYMSPEQHQGVAASPRSDQFSFCVSLWQALFGEHPFVTGRWVMAVAVDNMARDAVREPPSRGVPARVVRALRRGMRHDPDARWPSMHALIDRLAPRSRAPLYLGGLALAGIAGGVGLSLALGVGGGGDPCARAGSALAATWGPTTAKLLHDGFARTGLPYADGLATKVIARLDGYGTAWSAMRVDACRATRDRGEQSDTMLDRRMQCLDGRLAELGGVVRVLTRAPTRDVVDRSYALADSVGSLDACADTAALEQQAAPATSPAQRPELVATVAAVAQLRSELDAGVAVDPIAQSDVLLARARRLGEPSLVARALILAGDARLAHDDHAGAIPLWREAATTATRARDDGDAVHAMRQIAEGLSNAGKPDQALVALDDADVLASRGPLAPQLQSELLVVRAHALDDLSRFTESDQAYQRALDLDTKTYGADSWQVAVSMVDRSGTLTDANHYDEAVALVSRAIPLLEQALGPQHPELGVAHHNLGIAYLESGKNDDARRELEKSLAIKRARNPGGNSTIADTLQSLGTVEQNLSHLDRAEQYIQESLDMRTRLFGPDHPDTLRAVYALGTLRSQQGRFPEARALLQRALNGRIHAYGEQHVTVANTLDALGNVDLETGDVSAAADDRRRALAIREKLLGPDATDLTISLDGLAEIDLALERCPEARELADRATAIFVRANSPWWDLDEPLGIAAYCEERPDELAKLRAQLEPLLAKAMAGNVADRKGDLQFALGMVLYKQGDHGRGLAAIRAGAQAYRDGGEPAGAAPMEDWLRKHPP